MAVAARDRTRAALRPDAWRALPALARRSRRRRAARRPRRSTEAPRLGYLRAGRVGLELLKVTGSSFTRFVRDEYTTLPERVDRPLFIHLDVHWRYAQISDATGARHVALRRLRAGARRRRGRLLRARLRVDPAPRVGDVRAAAAAFPAARRGLVHRARTSRASRSPSVRTTSASRSRATRSPRSARSR